GEAGRGRVGDRQEPGDPAAALPADPDRDLDREELDHPLPAADRDPAHLHRKRVLMTTDIERGGIDVGSSHEPSYYEIALTNRQVVVAFVILLACVVAAFLSGVWIGRESAARAQQKLAMLGGAGPGEHRGGEAARLADGADGAGAGSGGSGGAAGKEKP